MAGFKGAIFDMDGTLLESMIEWRKQNIAFAERHNVEIPEEFRGKELDTSSHKTCKIYAEKYPHLGMTAEDVEHECVMAMLPIYKNNVQPKKGAKEFLEILAQNGVRMCVASATEAAVASQALAHHGMLPYMQFVVSTGDVGTSKGNPVYFPRVAGMLGLAPEDCVVFEDALYAVKSAKEAGMRVFAVEDYCARASFDEIRSLADLFRKDFEGISPLVQAMFQADHVCTMHLAGEDKCR